MTYTFFLCLKWLINNLIKIVALVPIPFTIKANMNCNMTKYHCCYRNGFYALIIFDTDTKNEKYFMGKFYNY